MHRTATDFMLPTCVEDPAYVDVLNGKITGGSWGQSIFASISVCNHVCQEDGRTKMDNGKHAVFALRKAKEVS